MPFPDGPLTGAPINFPSDSGGGGGGPPVQTLFFEDDETVAFPIGNVASDGCLFVELNLSNDLGESTCYRYTVAVSPTGLGTDCPTTYSDAPLLTVEAQPVISGGVVFLQLVGTGVGTPTAASYRVFEPLPRLLP